jgi:signal transduction histidine kinase
VARGDRVPGGRGLCAYRDPGRGALERHAASSRPPVETALYRVVQEALTNATRHGRPGRVRVEIDQDQGWLRGMICDDGVGFQVEHCVRNGGLGLEGMHERLGALGGSLQVVSVPGRVAEIRFRLPMGS